MHAITTHQTNSPRQGLGVIKFNLLYHCFTILYYV